MITAHMTDSQIQLYIAEPEAIEEKWKTHIQSCVGCQAKVTNYRLLFKAIHDNEKPRFDFDLAALVLEQLPDQKRAFPWVGILITGLSLLLIALAGVFFWPAMAMLLTNASKVVLITGGTAACVFLLFQVYDMFHKHQKQLHTLLNSKSLQL